MLVGKNGKGLYILNISNVSQIFKYGCLGECYCQHKIKAVRKPTNVIYHTNRMKERKTQDHLEWCRKSIWQKPTGTRNRREFHQHDKGPLLVTNKQKQLSADIISMWKTESFPIGIRNKTRMPTFTNAIQHCAGSSSQSNEERKIKGIKLKRKP